MSERDTPNEADAPLVGTPPDDAAAPMRLRAEPPRVTRLSRKVLGGISLVAALGVGGALIYALQTRSIGPGSEELYSTQNRRTADGLAGLPRDYTGPVLGPPLPGDLGRPILDAQNRGQPVTPPMAAAPTVDPVEQRRRAEEEAARTSRVFFQTEARVAAPIATAGGPGSPSLSGLGLPGQPGAATAQDRQLAFLNAGVDRRTVSPDRVMGPASPYVLQTGAVIAAALITGIRSDLPGQITAQVTEHVYDSPTGRILLVPQLPAPHGSCKCRRTCLAEPELGVRPITQKGTEELRQKPHGQWTKDADVKTSPTYRNRPRTLERGADLTCASACLMQKLLADLSQVDASAVAAKQPGANLILDIPDAPADHRLLDAKVLSRPPKTAALCGGSDVTQMA